MALGKMFGRADAQAFNNRRCSDKVRGNTRQCHHPTKRGGHAPGFRLDFGNGVTATALRQRRYGNGVAATALRQRGCGNGAAATGLRQRGCGNGAAVMVFYGAPVAFIHNIVAQPVILVMNPSTVRASVAPSELHIAPDAATFTLLPLSDLHLPTNPDATRKIVENRTYLRRMDMVLLLGDMVGSYGTAREYRAVDDFVQRLERPYMAINGNHEFYFAEPHQGQDEHGGLWQENLVANKACQLERFRRFFGVESLWRAQHTPLGSFILLGLDDVENHKVESLSATQFGFLAEQLRVAPQSPAFVFCHAPLMLDARLDMEYYEPERTACIEPPDDVRQALQHRAAPVFWMSGHIHLRPDHYLFDAYLLAPGVWQVHCPDSWGFSRWKREHSVPQRHGGLFSRHLEIARDSLTLVTHDHLQRQDIAHQTITFGSQ
jgi:hypothetical protein